MESSASTPILGYVFLLFLAMMYFVPTAIAQHRGRESWLLIGVCNLLFGWTVLGWFVLLVVAFTGESKAQRLMRQQEEQRRELADRKRDEELQLLRKMTEQQNGLRQPSGD